MTKNEANKTQFTFDVEINKVLHLMINSLYTNKDVAIRELISNAADACDKVKYMSRTDDSVLGEEKELKIKIYTDKAAKTLTIEDNGVGMSRDELIKNLGTIAKSGTADFMTALASGEKKDAMELIGQFGVGFYSAFMVADSVSVISRKLGEEKTYKWESKADGQFTVEEVTAEEDKKVRGTKITLHLKENEDEFLDRFHIKYVVQTYSDHISVPIEFIDKEDNDKVQTINSSSALWTRSKSEITEEEYNEFYKKTSQLPGNPLMTMHNKIEGNVQYTSLLYVPSMKPFDLYHPDRKTRVKLYIKKVFITEESVDLVPAYLRFVQGVVDSEDLPLNISRETLQHNNIMDKIRNSITSKILSELKKKANSDTETYEKIWKHFGPIIKEGLCEQGTNKEKILDVCRFYSSKSEDKLISLNEYLERMRDGQRTIFYATGENIDKIKDCPQLEGFIEKDIEVLYLPDSVDDFWVTVTTEYKGKNFKSITRAGIDLDNMDGNAEGMTDDRTDAKKEASSKTKDVTNSEFDGLITLFKGVLEGAVKDVKLSQKLSSSPVCLGVEENAMDIRMEKYLFEQKQIQGRTSKILEINPKHEIIKNLKAGLGDESKTEMIKDTIKLLYDEACIMQGENIRSIKDFTKQLNELISKRFK